MRDGGKSTTITALFISANCFIALMKKHFWNFLETLVKALKFNWYSKLKKEKQQNGLFISHFAVSFKISGKKLRSSRNMLKINQNHGYEPCFFFVILSRLAFSLRKTSPGKQSSRVRMGVVVLCICLPSFLLWATFSERWILQFKKSCLQGWNLKKFHFWYSFSYH